MLQSINILGVENDKIEKLNKEEFWWQCSSCLGDLKCKINLSRRTPIKELFNLYLKLLDILLAIRYYDYIRKELRKMDVARELGNYTIDDIYALPDGERAELIDGKIYYMAPPTWRHQHMSGYLYNQIYNYIKERDGKCEVLAAPFAVFLDENDKNYVEPDITIICDRDKLDEKGCHGAPDWVIEIVSPSSKAMDYFTKLFKYRTAGVREYWIVDPIKRRVTVYFFEKESVEDYSFGEDVSVGIYNDFSIRVQ